ncbi:hypothetical protein LX16_2435 [Stackebrandtia albiflava]|uniref:Uncharacterized protein n=1 Tax=Stackebrandtia albiflava TaxID=406432 RepID=A0A562V1E9_9ACTN|nr:hypothetical protein [Stackebrandtia albiflava]TWJ11708.1 hypothetical protein LX16_2435 [Stackebrandtia albiflava]
MTRRVLRMLGSRYGIAAILLLVVISVVAVAQDQSRSTPGDGGQQGNTVDNVEPGAPDDGFATPSADPGATSGPAADVLPDSAVDTATAFAVAWVDTGSATAAEWVDRLAPYATRELHEQLAGVDPVSVPATEVRGEGRASAAHVEFDTDAGLLILRMTEENGGWLVAGIDFRRP